MTEPVWEPMTVKIDFDLTRGATLGDLRKFMKFTEGFDDDYQIAEWDPDGNGLTGMSVWLSLDDLKDEE